MSIRRSLFVLLVVGVAWAGPESTRGAPRYPPRPASHPHPKKPAHKPAQKPPSVSTVTLEGTVQSIGSKGFKINASTSQAGTNKPGKKTTPTKERLVAPTKTTTWLVRGTAEANYLKPGLTVIFKATLDDQGQPEDKVRMLTIVSARENSPGIKADDGKGPVPPRDPGIGTAPPVESQSKKVVGRITACSKTKLTVNAGKTIEAGLAENPTINVALSDHKLMVVGSKVTVRGRAMKTKNASYCAPNSVTVTLTQPLTGKENPSDLAPPDEPAIPKEAMEEDDDDNAPAEKAAPDKAADGKAADEGK